MRTTTINLNIEDRNAIEEALTRFADLNHIANVKSIDLNITPDESVIHFNQEHDAGWGGAGIGGALGLIFGGPLGAAAGAALGGFVSSLASDPDIKAVATDLVNTVVENKGMVVDQADKDKYVSMILNIVTTGAKKVAEKIKAQQEKENKEGGGGTLQNAAPTGEQPAPAAAKQIAPASSGAAATASINEYGMDHYATKSTVGKAVDWIGEGFSNIFDNIGDFFGGTTRQELVNRLVDVAVKKNPSMAKSADQFKQYINSFIDNGFQEVSKEIKQQKAQQKQAPATDQKQAPGTDQQKQVTRQQIEKAYKDKGYNTNDPAVKKQIDYAAGLAGSEPGTEYTKMLQQQGANQKQQEQQYADMANFQAKRNIEKEYGLGMGQQISSLPPDKQQALLNDPRYKQLMAPAGAGANATPAAPASSGGAAQTTGQAPAGGPAQTTGQAPAGGKATIESTQQEEARAAYESYSDFEIREAFLQWIPMLIKYGPMVYEGVKTILDWKKKHGFVINDELIKTAGMVATAIATLKTVSDIAQRALQAAQTGVYGEYADLLVDLASNFGVDVSEIHSSLKEVIDGIVKVIDDLTSKGDAAFNESGNPGEEGESISPEEMEMTASYLRLNSETFNVRKGSMYYDAIEDISRRIANAYNIDNVSEIELNITPVAGTVVFRKQADADFLSGAASFLISKYLGQDQGMGTSLLHGLGGAMTNIGYPLGVAFAKYMGWGTTAQFIAGGVGAFADTLITGLFSDDEKEKKTSAAIANESLQQLKDSNDPLYQSMEVLSEKSGKPISDIYTTVLQAQAR